MKKVVVIGGGTGMSNLLRGLKQFPLDITSIVTVCDDGKSTGILREEFNIPKTEQITAVIALGYGAKQSSPRRDREIDGSAKFF